MKSSTVSNSVYLLHQECRGVVWSDWTDSLQTNPHHQISIQTLLNCGWCIEVHDITFVQTNPPYWNIVRRAQTKTHIQYPLIIKTVRTLSDYVLCVHSGQPSLIIGSLFVIARAFKQATLHFHIIFLLFLLFSGFPFLLALSVTPLVCQQLVCSCCSRLDQMN